MAHKKPVQKGDKVPTKKDSKGRRVVPSGWSAPSGFRGNVVTESGIPMSYPGPMARDKSATKAKVGAAKDSVAGRTSKHTKRSR